MIRSKNLAPELRSDIAGQGSNILGVAERIYCVKAGDAPADYLAYKRPSDNIQYGLPAAYAQAVSGRNDQVIVTPSSHSLGDTLTWAKNMTHLSGSYPAGRFNVRNRIGMSTAFTPMVEVTGYGNVFSDIYTMHGTANTDLIGWRITGPRNTFNRVHFGGPMNAALGLITAYHGVSIGGAGREISFNGCTFGTATIPRDEVISSNLQIVYSTSGSQIVTIDDCLFVLMAADTEPVFIRVENTSSTIQVHIDNTRFFCHSTNMAVAAAVGIDVTSTATCAIMLGPNVQFFNTTLVCASADEPYVWVPDVQATDLTLSRIGIKYDAD